MPTTGEKKALWFVAIVALSGSVVRLSRANDVGVVPVDTTALAGQLARVDSVRERGYRTRGRRPFAAGVRGAAPDSPRSANALIDLDRASATEIEALPGIGPALAQRIVANRDSSGAFGHIEALCDVPGVGVSMVQRLRPLVTFTGAPRPLSDECGGASKTPRQSRGSRTRKAR
ncbi:MAG TPA: ComEA family DNA-binding protein [Gemmatimonadaceae bacterium]|nr:ComEA family DNA-binding protein [Gemmatimonadaceae bacterium]